MSDVLVVGCGLIGASVGMALRDAGRDVCVHDEVPSVVGEAVRRGAGRPWDGSERTGIALIAVPPRVTADALIKIQSLDIARTYTHVASVQSQVQREVEASSPNPSLVVGGHPLAGREQSGPGAATADLFAGRPWALCAGPTTSEEARSDVAGLIADCGADAVVLSAAEHDASVALLSHLPQLTASALAAELVGKDADRVSLTLAGPGLVDTTRLAASDAELWAQIVELNAAEIAPVMTALAGRLTAAAAALTELGAAPSPPVAARAVADLRALLRDGNAGRALVPVKRGAASDAFAPLRVSVSDRPGRLAALLGDAGAAGVNVEDVHVEHIPGRPTGVIELLVRHEDLDRLAAVLAPRGWHVLGLD